jgi:hypothetical protein
LEKDPNKRIDLEGIKAHPWLAYDDSIGDREVAEEKVTARMKQLKFVVKDEINSGSNSEENVAYRIVKRKYLIEQMKSKEIENLFASPLFSKPVTESEQPAKSRPKKK